MSRIGFHAPLADLKSLADFRWRGASTDMERSPLPKVSRTSVRRTNLLSGHAAMATGLRTEAGTPSIKTPHSAAVITRNTL